LYAVDAAAGSGVTVDEEGGTTIANSKTRFVAPALALLALRGSAHQEHELDTDDPGQAAHVVTHSNPGAKAVGGLFGFSGIGAVLAQFSRPVAIGLSAVGASRTVYRNVIAKGQEVTFSADTPIEVRLAPRLKRAINKNKPCCSALGAGLVFSPHFSRRRHSTPRHGSSSCRCPFETRAAKS
jgi:hypothetical protein